MRKGKGKRKRGRKKDNSDRRLVNEVDQQMTISSVLNRICDDRSGAEDCKNAILAYFKQVHGLDESTTMEKFAQFRGACNRKAMLECARGYLRDNDTEVGRQELNGVLCKMVNIEVTGGSPPEDVSNRRVKPRAGSQTVTFTASGEEREEGGRGRTSEAMDWTPPMEERTGEGETPNGR